jgi:hypothetical protein
MTQDDAPFTLLGLPAQTDITANDLFNHFKNHTAIHYRQLKPAPDPGVF